MSRRGTQIAHLPRPCKDTAMANHLGSLMSLDSASMYFRAFFGVPDSVKAPNGTPVNGVRGFCDMIARLVREFEPSQIVATWDNDWRPDFRVQALPSYKAHRVDPQRSEERRVGKECSARVAPACGQTPLTIHESSPRK